jgi:hypothetical protein
MTDGPPPGHPTQKGAAQTMFPGFDRATAGSKVRAALRPAPPPPAAAAPAAPAPAPAPDPSAAAATAAAPPPPPPFPLSIGDRNRNKVQRRATMPLEFSAPCFESLRGLRQYLPGERPRKLRAHRANRRRAPRPWTASRTTGCSPAWRRAQPRRHRHSTPSSAAIACHSVGILLPLRSCSVRMTVPPRARRARPRRTRR